MSGRRALVTGITGQDGGYLAEQLLAEGTEVHGLVHHQDSLAADFARSHPEVVLHPGDLADHAGLRALVEDVEPDELYNLAGVSSVAFSWEHPVTTAELTGVAAAVMLQAALAVQERTGRRVAFVQASSSEIFGEADVFPQDETTPVRPVSPYGAAKAFAHHMVTVYRGKGLHATSCILFNHESPRRPPTFVTRKITAAAARIGRSGAGTITLGNLDARRDWGWAPDYVDAMVRAARHTDAGDFVIATGETHTVEEFAETALRRAGAGDHWREHVEVDPDLLRPVDTPLMVGDAGKALRELGWKPSVGFAELVAKMVDHDIELLQEG
ncbi:MAG: GDP-mannose 4,6 dehydratase [Cellulomonas sp. 73-145]|uniref:GDP-mannose 4,6-dehydratase n=1 Tax=unclassified Cellulomonas TaxID=2620175 RepID=UPI00092BC754|nr:GDP-mannose 4,6-dehydratase [Cellulomonas sp. 73-145]MBN9328383.1 GDP-mannose 4,6-dehydratase [Cellulomonas sp.]OJV59750.1 MAG: GDP-mannose 4,6 dehydratase [Cellulomonas sp. 73-145]